MKISIYELLGLIKDNKAPKKVKYLDKEFIYGAFTNFGDFLEGLDGEAYNGESSGYWCEEENGWLNMYLNLNKDLNDEVEIIEEKETKPSEEEIETFKEQFNNIWNSIKSVLGGVLEALIKIDEQEVVKKVLEEENNKIEKLPYYSLKKIQKAKNEDEWYEERIALLEKRANDYHNKINEIIDAINELKGNDKD